MKRLLPAAALLPLPAWSAQPDMNIGMALMSLLLVLGLIVGLGWVAKRMRLPFNGHGNMRVEHPQALGQRERLMVVNVEGQRLLLGVTPQSISLLKELGDAPENHANPPSGFQQQLNALLEKRKSAAKSAASASDNESAH